MNGIPLACLHRQMDPLLISAAGGMKSGMDPVDMLANNIANMGTVGFKADSEFHGLYQQQLPVIEKQWTDFSQGALTTTAKSVGLGSGREWLLRVELAHRESCIRGTASFRFRKPASCKRRRVTRCASWATATSVTLHPRSPLSIPARVRQGTLEQSNVEVADSTVRLISIMRQFEMLQKAISVGSAMNAERRAGRQTQLRRIG